MLVCPAGVSLRAGANLWADHFSCNDIAKRGRYSLWYQMTVLYDLFKKEASRDWRRRCCWSFSKAFGGNGELCIFFLSQKLLSRVNKLGLVLKSCKMSPFFVHVWSNLKVYFFLDIYQENDRFFRIL